MIQRCWQDDPDSRLSFADMIPQLNATYAEVEEAPAEFICPITYALPRTICSHPSLEIMKEPVIAKSGITYEKSALLKVIGTYLKYRSF